jgi:hypothetical protein
MQREVPQRETFLEFSIKKLMGLTPVADLIRFGLHRERRALRRKLAVESSGNPQAG